MFCVIVSSVCVFCLCYCLDGVAERVMSSYIPGRLIHVYMSTYTSTG